VNEVWQWQDCAGYLYLVGLERGSGRAYWPCHFPATTQPGINTPHNPATAILHSPAYEDGTDSEYGSGRIVRGIYTWLGWSGEVAELIGLATSPLQPNQV